MKPNNFYQIKACVYLLAATASLFAAESVLAGGLPQKLSSAICKAPPIIDGRIDPAEWKDVPVIEFELPTLQVKTQKTAQRNCQWQAMNSANGLYVALRIPDTTLNDTLTPLNFDFAVLAFCLGDKLAAGDDRKAVAPGLYFDKHFIGGGKDEDDKHADGKGAMRHNQSAGHYTIELAIPLDSGDQEDLQAKPGSKLKFNLGYIDAFQVDLKETQIGSAFIGGLDVATSWGVLELASEVSDDGGAAFQGPTWVRKRFEEISVNAGRRFRVVDATLIQALGSPIAKVQIEYNYRDPSGKLSKGKAKLYFPTKDEQVPGNLPLIYHAGYEANDGNASALVNRGFAVVTPQALESNPLVRTVNPDCALLHISRALPIIDDSKVVIIGGSAGGYATLMVAAESFPLAGAAPSVPPVNWGYNAAYFLQRETGESHKNATTPKTPVFDVIVPIVQQGTKVYGNETSNEVYYQHSPLAHFDTITCPVSVYWTTADMLVPIDQVGKAWVRPFDPAKFPPSFTFDPDKLTNSSNGRTRLVDVLNPKDYEVFVIAEETAKKLVGAPAADQLELKVSATKQWSITIVDEGAPEPQLGHAKYPVPWSQQAFVNHVLKGEISLEQLTARKLERMMDRYAGREWQPTALRHLDEANYEQADVLRGLKTYSRQGKTHQQRFSDLYQQLSNERKVLPREALEQLKGNF